ncbi:hypothetical protein CsatB_002174 [Cannabis sativa]
MEKSGVMMIMICIVVVGLVFVPSPTFAISSSDQDRIMINRQDRKVVTIMNRDTLFELQISAKRAGLDMIEKMKGNSMKCVKEIVEMEKLTDYTCNPEFEIEYKKFMAKKDVFMSNVSQNSMNILEDEIGGILEHCTKKAC